MNGKMKETDFSILMKKKNDLKQKSKVADDELNFQISKEILEVESKLAGLVADKNRQKVAEDFGNISNEGLLNLNGMCALQ